MGVHLQLLKVNLREAQGNLKMLDYQLHYARMLAEDRLRETTARNQHVAAARIFRLRRPRPAARNGR